MTKITRFLSDLFGPKHARPGEDRLSDPEEDETHRHFKVVRFVQTPNPEAGQFIMSHPVVRPGGTRTFDSPDTGDAFVQAMFKVFGVESLFLKENFVTVTKSSTINWTSVMGALQETMEKHLAYYEKADEDEQPKEKETAQSLLEEVDVEDFPNFDNEQKGKIIDAVLDHAIRPALANDGGGITLIGVEGDVVQIHYQGACGTCPSSTTGTLQYIETFLQDTLHKNLTVKTVDTHAA